MELISKYESSGESIEIRDVILDEINHKLRNHFSDIINKILRNTTKKID